MPAVSCVKLFCRKTHAAERPVAWSAAAPYNFIFSTIRLYFYSTETFSWTVDGVSRSVERVRRFLDSQR